MVGIICFNEKQTISAAVESVYDFADKIVIVEGADRKYPLAANSKDGLSTDGTTQIIKDLIKDSGEDKIIHKPIGWVDNKSELRQAYVDYAQEQKDKIDWILVLDADESYFEHQLRLLDSYVEDNKDLFLILNDVYWFWDWDKICVKNTIQEEYPIIIGKHPDAYPKITYFEDKDTISQVYQGQLEERIFRNLPGLNYSKSHANICDANKTFLYSQGEYHGKRRYILNPWLNRYHYYFLDAFKREEIIKYYAIRDEGIDPQDKEAIQRQVNKHPFYAWLNQGKQMGKLIEGIKPGMKVIKFQREHIPSFQRLR